jgi:peptidoglycan/xylan/chitin deacetylase (PgdA/CDA1 family)
MSTSNGKTTHLKMAPFHLWNTVHGRYMRSTAKFAFRRPFAINTPVPIISFTFDDFPRSAVHAGGAILERYGAKGTYYTSFGLMGKQAPTGTIFLREDLQPLIDHGHELGCHTFAHYDSWATESSVFEASIEENQRTLDALYPGATFKTFSYPINPPRARTKQRMARHFACCRGGGQTFNTGTTDLNYLSACFLEKNRNNPEVLKSLVDQNRQANGWLIFATHDVCKDPTPYGVTPELFEDIVQYAAKSGARILPVVQAWEALRASSAS